VKIINRIHFVLAAVTICLLALPVTAFSYKGNSASVNNPVFPQTAYQAYSNGWPGNPSVFPVAMWLVNPVVSGPLYYTGAYSNAAQAEVGNGINIQLGLYGWPEYPTKDSGEAAALATAPTLKFIGGGSIAYKTNKGAQTVAAAQAVAASAGVSGQMIGYLVGDEPNCDNSGSSNPSGLAASGVPAAITAVNRYDSTRFAYFGSLGWQQWYLSNTAASSCGGSRTAKFNALTEPFPNSFDVYPGISAFELTRTGCPSGAHVTRGNYAATNPPVYWDCDWETGESIANAYMIQVLKGVNKPVWIFLAGQNDALGFSGGANSCCWTATLTSGSTTLTNTTTNPLVSFTAALFDGLTVTDSLGCIPANTTLTGTPSDANHMTMTHAATSPCTKNTSDSITITGGDDGNRHGCKLPPVNMCAPFGNRFRDLPQQVNDMAWGGVINGGMGLEYFPQDSVSGSFSLGGSQGGRLSAAVPANLQYINATMQTYAAVLQQPAIARVSMINPTDQTTVSTRTSGILTMATGAAAVPGWAALYSSGGKLYLFVEQCRLGSATFTYTLKGYAGKVATIVYDSDGRYNAPGNVGATFTLNGSAQFSDTLASTATQAYQVKGYTIQ
jgi:hypothetical protein